MYLLYTYFSIYLVHIKMKKRTICYWCSSSEQTGFSVYSLSSKWDLNMNNLQQTRFILHERSCKIFNWRAVHICTLRVWCNKMYIVISNPMINSKLYSVFWLYTGGLSLCLTRDIEQCTITKWNVTNSLLAHLVCTFPPRTRKLRTSYKRWVSRLLDHGSSCYS